jgi:hypothetical protein
MKKDSDDLSRKQQRFSKRQAIVGGCVLLLVLTLLGFFAVVRPVIVMEPEGPSVDVKNEGGMTALIYKVDGFWYWGGQVAFLGNMPSIHQRVEATATPVRLQVPDIPAPSGKIAQGVPCYMKLVVRYGIPGIPIFRYTAVSHFEFDPCRQMWVQRKSIPPEYRSLGNLAMGNVGRIELEFH